MPFPNSTDTEEDCRTHFAKAKVPFTEDAMLGVLALQDNQWDVFYGVIALRTMGTNRAIGPLKQVLRFPKADVQCTAILTVAHLAGAKETPFFVSTLEDAQYRHKLYALWALADSGDERGIDAVIEYLATRIPKARMAKPNGSFFPTVYQGLCYLSRFTGKHPIVRNEIARWMELVDGAGVHNRPLFTKLFTQLGLSPQTSEVHP